MFKKKKNDNYEKYIIHEMATKPIKNINFVLYLKFIMLS